MSILSKKFLLPTLLIIVTLALLGTNSCKKETPKQLIEENSDASILLDSFTISERVADYPGDVRLAPEAGLPACYPVSQEGNSCQSHAGAWALSWTLYRRANPGGQNFQVAYYRSPYYVAYQLRQNTEIKFPVSIDEATGPEGKWLAFGAPFTNLPVIAQRLIANGSCTFGQYNHDQAWPDNSNDAQFLGLSFNAPNNAANVDAGNNRAIGSLSLPRNGNNTGISRTSIRDQIDLGRAVLLKIWLNSGNVLPLTNYTFVNGNVTPFTWHQQASNTHSLVSENAHIVTVYGYNNSRGVFYCQNSWGPAWGDGEGRFAISFETIDANSSQAQAIW